MSKPDAGILRGPIKSPKELTMKTPPHANLCSVYGQAGAYIEPAPLSDVARQFLSNRFAIILGRLAAINSHLGEKDSGASCRLGAVQNEIIEIGAWAGLPGFVCAYPFPASHH